MTEPAAIANPETLLSHVLKDRRKWWTAATLAELLGLHASHIYTLLDGGELEAHNFGKRKTGWRSDRQHAASDLFATERRAGTRITRRSVIAYLIKTADYDLGAEEITAAIIHIARDLPEPALIALERAFAEVRRRRAAA